MAKSDLYILPGPFDPSVPKLLQAWVEGSREPLSWEELSRRMYDSVGVPMTAYVMNMDGLKRWLLFTDLALMLEIDDPYLTRVIFEQLASSEKPGRIFLPELLRRINRLSSHPVAVEAFAPAKRGFSLQIRFRINLPGCNSRIVQETDTPRRSPEAYAVQ